MEHRTALNMAVVGAGPVGLALALHAATTLPHAQVTVFDARPAERDVSADPRTLALSLGSVQLLRRLAVMPAAEAITQVHVSQQPPSFGQAEVCIAAAEENVAQLGAVLAYGRLVAAMQQAWLAAAAAAPLRLRSRFGTPVSALKDLPEGGGVEIDAGIAEPFDLAIVAEGGVFADQARKAVVHDYGQTAWVGTVTLEGGTPGLAIERFTRQGPAALLPLGGPRWALVWCVNSADDPVRELDDNQRLAVLASVFPPLAGRPVALSPLKAFALGLNAERTLVAGRTVRIGNAAQTLHPVAGQGLNLGLRDAHALVAALRQGGDDVDAALRQVEWTRGADRWATIASTDFLARSFTWQLPGAALARGLGLAALQALPPVKHWLARQMMFGLR
ncbi:MAG: FAD-dependent monooxygenase [Rubrivivax sp.]